MPPTPTALACNRCGTAIQTEELGQGLAVRVDGELVCAMCVDSLPGEAQIQINQMRAIKGLNATTYQLALPAAPNLQLFTFTTVGNVTQHRRKLVADGFFEAPPLPPPSERAAPDPPTGSIARNRAAPAVTAAPAPAANRRVMLIAVAATVALLGGGALVLTLLAARHSPAPQPAVAANPPPLPERPEPAKPAKTRFDYSVDPLQGWIQASQDRDCPDFVRSAITQELQRKRSQQLDQAEQALADRRLDDASRLANALSVPDDIAFRDLGAREQRLRKQLLDSRTLSSLKPEPPRSEPAPEPVVPAPGPVVAPAATPPAPPAPVAAGAAWKAPGSELLAGEETPEWKRPHSGELQLNTDAASLHRVLSTAGGRYQVWLQVHNHSGDSSLQGSVAGMKARPVSIRKGGHSIWVQLLNDQDNLFPVPAAGGALDLIATGKGLVFTHAYLAEPGAPGPEQGLKQAKPLAWDVTPPAPTAPVAPASSVAIWKPLFIQLPRETPIRPLPLDGSALIPAGWPGGCDDFYRSAKSAGKKRHTMVLDLSANASAKGGVALLIHPARVDRKQLVITVGDGVDKHVVLPPLQFADNQWTTFVIPASAAPELAQIATITLEDDAGLDFVAEDGGFLLARAAVCSNRAPGAEMLGVRPPSLVRDDQRVKALLRLLEALGRFRRRSWAKATDPAKLRVLAPAPFGQDWRVEVRQRIEALPLGKLPGAAFAELSFQDSWLDGMFKSAGQNQPAVLDPQLHHVVMICTGGVELAGGASAAQALDGFWKKRLEQLINNGILPVVALGPDRVPEERRAEAAKLWTDLAEFIAKRLPGVPMIDLRATANAKHPDVVFEDWSKDTYAGWTVEGTAFGSGPRKRSQTPAGPGDGGDDERVANSFAATATDSAVGKLTSRSFVIEHDYIRFPLGGGDAPTQLGLRVLVGGAVVASATGRNDNRMSQQVLDVRAYSGKEAVIEIVDAATGGFGQIGVGRIVFTDVRPEAGGDQATANRWTADLVADGYAEFTYWLRRVGGAK